MKKYCGEAMPPQMPSILHISMLLINALYVSAWEPKNVHVAFHALDTHGKAGKMENNHYNSQFFLIYYMSSWPEEFWSPNKGFLYAGI